MRSGFEGLGWDWVEMRFCVKIEIECIGKNPFAEAHHRIAFLHSQCPLVSWLMLFHTQHSIVEKEARKNKGQDSLCKFYLLKLERGKLVLGKLYK